VEWRDGGTLQPRDASDDELACFPPTGKVASAFADPWEVLWRFDKKHCRIDFCTERTDIGFAFNPASRPAIDRFDVKTVEYPHGLRSVAGL
jgi:hypothetical protein